jgi:hypothetical protein
VESAAAFSVDSVPEAEAERSRSSVIAWREDVRRRARGRRSHATDHPSPLRRGAWLCAIALHLLLIVGLRLTLRPTAPAAADADVMQVDLVDLPLPEPTLPEPARPSPRPPSKPQQRPPRATSHATAKTPSAPPAVAPEPAPLRLFNPDGSAMLPDDIATQLDSTRPQPDFIARRYEPSPILAVKRPIKVRPNHFAQYWAGTDGMPLHEALFRRLTVVKEFTAPWGGKYACAWVLILVACGDVPDKPWTPPTTWKPATEFDEQ